MALVNRSCSLRFLHIRTCQRMSHKSLTLLSACSLPACSVGGGKLCLRCAGRQEEQAGPPSQEGRRGSEADLPRERHLPPGQRQQGQAAPGLPDPRQAGCGGRGRPQRQSPQSEHIRCESLSAVHVGHLGAVMKMLRLHVPV